MKLREYQQEIVDEVVALAAFGMEDIVIAAPTGTGKSVIIKELLSALDGKKTVSVTMTKLLHQLTKLIPEASVIKAGMEDKFDEDNPVQIAMEQTIYARKTKIKSDFLIRDEHHIGLDGDRYTFLKSLSKHLIAFTATPYDQYGIALKDAKIINTHSKQWFIDRGYLKEAVTEVYDIGRVVELAELRAAGNDYSSTELETYVYKEEYNNFLVENVNKSYPKGERGLLYTASIDHAIELQNKFNEDTDIKAAAVHSKQPKSMIDRTLAEFEAGNIDLLISVSSLIIGADFPFVNLLVNARPTKIHSLYEQMIGRVLRPDGKEEPALIMDFANATIEHGLYNETYRPKKTHKEAKEALEKIRKPIIRYAMAKYTIDEFPFVILTKKPQKDIERWEDTLKFDDSTEAYIYRFEESKTARKLIYNALVLEEKFTGKKSIGKTMEWILETVEPGVEKYGLNMYKNRARKILKEGKKIAGLHYYTEWFEKNVIGGK